MDKSIKKAVVALEFRFHSFQGNTYTDSSFNRSFWERYLDEFDEILVVARCRPLKSISRIYKQVNDEKVKFIALPFYIGPIGFLKVFIPILLKIKEASSLNATYILRAPGILSFVFGIFLNLRKKPFGIEVVGNPHTVFTKENFNSFIALIYREIFSKTLKFLCNKAACISYVTKESLQKDFYPNPKAFTTNYSSVDLSKEFYIDPRSRIHRNSSFKLLFIGSLDQKYKGLNVLLSGLAFKRLAEYKFSLTVIGEGKFKNDYVEMSKKLGIRDKINFKNYMSNQKELIKFYKNSDILIIPSLSEGLPRVAIEGAAASLPIIGTNVGAFQKLSVNLL